MLAVNNFIRSRFGGGFPFAESRISTSGSAVLAFLALLVCAFVPILILLYKYRFAWQGSVHTMTLYRNVMTFADSDLLDIRLLVLLTLQVFNIIITLYLELFCIGTYSLTRP